MGRGMKGHEGIFSLTHPRESDLARMQSVASRLNRVLSPFHSQRHVCECAEAEDSHALAHVQQQELRAFVCSKHFRGNSRKVGGGGWGKGMVERIRPNRLAREDRHVEQQTQLGGGTALARIQRSTDAGCNAAEKDFQGEIWHGRGTKCSPRAIAT